jgi:hypothetical protein
MFLKRNQVFIFSSLGRKGIFGNTAQSRNIKSPKIYAHFLQSAHTGHYLFCIDFSEYIRAYNFVDLFV